MPTLIKKPNKKIIKGSFLAIAPLAGIYKNEKLDILEIRKAAWK